MSLGMWSAKLDESDTPAHAVILDPDGNEVGLVFPYDRDSTVPPTCPGGFVAVCWAFGDMPPHRSKFLTQHFLDRDGTPFVPRWDEGRGWHLESPLPLGRGQYASWIDMAMEAGLILPRMQDTG